MTDFQHQPLKANQIRLLRLQRGKPSRYMRCELNHAVMDSPECPRYTAISYCWGDNTTNKLILLNGKRHRVTENVHDLLNSLLSKSIGWLWIDAICLNQDDNDEKSGQIGSMGRIYSNARLCHVWLGNEADGSNTAIGLLRTMVKELPQLELSKAGLEAFLLKLKAPHGGAKWKALARFCDRPWFYRMWVIQEAVLSSDKLLFHCGSQQISFYDFWDVFERLQSAGALGLLLPDSREPFDTHTLPRAFSQLRLIVALRYSAIDNCSEYFDSFGLEDAIQFSSVAFATNPRDHIYGVYGIVPDATDEELKPDYNASVEDIYIKTTKFMMSRNNSLRLLLDAGICAPSRLDVPSWVPNYNVPRDSSRIGAMFYTASESMAPQIQWDATSDYLTTSGLVLDDVILTSEQNLILGEAHSVYDIRTWYQEAEKLIASYNASINSKNETKISTEVLWNTLLIGRTLNSENMYEDVSPECGVAFEGFHQFMTCLDEFEGLMMSEWDTEAPARKPLMDTFRAALSFFTVAVETWAGRKLVVTRSGRLGFVPHLTDVGDRISIILGARTPFVLRPGEEGSEFEGKFRIVGECYVYGLMHGEGLEMGDGRDIVIY